MPSSILLLAGGLEPNADRVAEARRQATRCSWWGLSLVIEPPLPGYHFSPFWFSLGVASQAWHPERCAFDDRLNVMEHCLSSHTPSPPTWASRASRVGASTGQPVNARG